MKKKININESLKSTDKQLKCQHHWVTVGYSGCLTYGHAIKMCMKCSLVQ